MELKTVEVNAHLGELGQFDGIAGEAGVEAAPTASRNLGVPVEAVAIGPGREVLDVYDDRARPRQVEGDGALLVRPDKHIAHRSTQRPADTAECRRAGSTTILGRGEAQ